MTCSHEFAEASGPDSLSELSREMAGGWRAVMTPIVDAIRTWLARQPDLQAAIDGLAGQLPSLPSGDFRGRLERANFQAHLAGLLGVPVSDAEARESAAEADFAEATGRVQLRPLTDVEAVRFLTNKQVGGRFSFDWRDVREAEHVASFVVAKAMNASLLGDVHQGLVRAVEQGWTRDRFIRELTPILQRAGWWGLQSMTDPLTGEDRLVQLGSPRRLKTIFDVNVRMAHAAGRWERLQRTARPGDLLRYTAVLDERTRAQHRAWHGISLPASHPFWRTHYPPNGWNCRCTVTLISTSRAARLGIRQTSEEDLLERGFGRTRPWLNRRTGELEEVPAGVDPGFGYNVGEASLDMFEPRPSGGGRGGGGPPDRPPPDAPPGGSPGPGSPAPPAPEPTPTLPPPSAHPAGPATPEGPAAPPPPALTPTPPPLLGLQSRRPPLPAARPFPDPWPAPEPADPEAAVAGFIDLFRPHAMQAARNALVYLDKAQVPLVISRSLFTDATGALKVEKRGRLPFLPVLARTVLDPDEIWLRIEEVRDQAGRLLRYVVRRRFVAMWIVPGSRQQAQMVVFEEDGDLWDGITAHPVGIGDSLGKQMRQLDRYARAGVLVWRRER